jgi:hypothetical protein
MIDAANRPSAPGTNGERGTLSFPETFLLKTSKVWQVTHRLARIVPANTFRILRLRFGFQACQTFLKGLYQVAYDSGKL